MYCEDGTNVTSVIENQIKFDFKIILKQSDLLISCLIRVWKVEFKNLIDFWQIKT